MTYLTSHQTGLHGLGWMQGTSTDPLTDVKPKACQHPQSCGRAAWNTFTQHQGTTQAGADPVTSTPKLPHSGQGHAGAGRHAGRGTELCGFQSKVGSIGLVLQTDGCDHRHQ